jgi:hypothetical protein
MTGHNFKITGSAILLKKSGKGGECRGIGQF